MFSQLYISTQVRGGDIQKLFNHETRKELQSLAKTGENRGGVKADIPLCIKAKVVPTKTKPWAKSAALEGSVLVNTAKSGNEKTIYSYVNNSIFPRIKLELTKVQRVDMVFDAY